MAQLIKCIHRNKTLYHSSVRNMATKIFNEKEFMKMITFQKSSFKKIFFALGASIFIVLYANAQYQN